MKRFLLSLAVAVGAVVTVNAQTYYTQDFEAPTVVPALPTGYTAVLTPGMIGPGWKTGTFPPAGWGTATGTTPAAHAGQVGLIDDWNDSLATQQHFHDTMKTATFAIPGAATNVWVNYDFYFFNAVRSSTNRAEKAYLIGSMTGGSSWVMLDTLVGGGFSEAWVTGHAQLPSAFIGSSNVKLAFTYSDSNDHLIGVALDNISVVQLPPASAAVTALAFNSSTNGISIDGSPVAFLVKNTGNTITSFTASFTVNGGAPTTQNFTSLSIAPYAQQAFQFTGTIAGSIAGSNTIRVVIDTVNAARNAEADSFEVSSYIRASASTNRQGLIEELSSSTCAPCKAFNQDYDPLCTSLNTNMLPTRINVLKYQMNWPSPGTDRSYNPDGNTRRGYYGVNSIPIHFVNGSESTVSGSSFSVADYTDEANGSKLFNAFLDMEVTYTVDTVRKKVGSILKVTPHFTKTGNYHVYIALADKKYQNTTNTTGQLDYLHVMRVMLPSASGHAVTSWTDGTAQTFVDTGVSYTSGDWTTGVASYPTQGSAKFWANPYLNSEMIAFVQEDGNKSVMQSLLAFPAGTVSVSTLSKVDGIMVFPNPAKNDATVRFNLREAGNVHITLIDYTGRVVSEVTNTDMAAGLQRVSVNTSNVAPGNYIVKISTKGGSNAERLTVEK